MTRQSLLVQNLVYEKYLYQTRWNTESVFNTEIILLAYEFMKNLAYVHLLMKIKQQNLTDNNLLK